MQGIRLLPDHSTTMGWNIVFDATDSDEFPDEARARYDDGNQFNLAVIATPGNTAQGIVNLFDQMVIEDVVAFYQRVVSLKIMNPKVSFGLLLLRNQRLLDVMLVNSNEVIHVSRWVKHLPPSVMANLRVTRNSITSFPAIPVNNEL